MAVGMMRTMEEAMRAVRLMRDNGDDDGGEVKLVLRTPISARP